MTLALSRPEHHRKVIPLGGDYRGKAHLVHYQANIPTHSTPSIICDKGQSYQLFIPANESPGSRRIGKQTRSLCILPAISLLPWLTPYGIGVSPSAMISTTSQHTLRIRHLPPRFHHQDPRLRKASTIRYQRLRGRYWRRQQVDLSPSHQARTALVRLVCLGPRCLPSHKHTRTPWPKTHSPRPLEHREEPPKLIPAPVRYRPSITSTC